MESLDFFRLTFISGTCRRIFRSVEPRYFFISWGYRRGAFAPFHQLFFDASFFLYGRARAQIVAFGFKFDRHLLSLVFHHKLFGKSLGSECFLFNPVSYLDIFAYTLRSDAALVMENYCRGRGRICVFRRISSNGGLFIVSFWGVCFGLSFRGGTDGVVKCSERVVIFYFSNGRRG